MQQANTLHNANFGKSFWKTLANHSIFSSFGTPGNAHPGMRPAQIGTPGNLGIYFLRSIWVWVYWLAAGGKFSCFRVFCLQKTLFFKAFVKSKWSTFLSMHLSLTPGNAHPGMGMDFSGHPGIPTIPGCYTRDEDTMLVITCQHHRSNFGGSFTFRWNSSQNV